MSRLALVAAGACIGCTSAPMNPKTLWLAPGATETQLVLADHEPPPF